MSENLKWWYGRVRRDQWTDAMRARAEAADGVRLIDEDDPLFGPSDAPVLLHWLATDKESALRRIYDSVGVHPGWFDSTWTPQELPGAEEAWQPMSIEEARRLVDGMPSFGTTSKEVFGRFIEARMVAAGDPPERIRTVLEKFYGRGLD